MCVPSFSGRLKSSTSSVNDVLRMSHSNLKSPFKDSSIIPSMYVYTPIATRSTVASAWALHITSIHVDSRCSRDLGGDGSARHAATPRPSRCDRGERQWTGVHVSEMHTCGPRSDQPFNNWAVDIYTEKQLILVLHNLEGARLLRPRGKKLVHPPRIHAEVPGTPTGSILQSRNPSTFSGDLWHSLRARPRSVSR